MKLVIARANEHAVTDRQDAGGGFGQLLGPHLVAGFERQCQDPSIFQREVETLSSGGWSRTSIDRRTKVLLPDDVPIGGTNGEKETGLGLHEQPAGVPMHRRHFSLDRAAPLRFAVGIGPCFDEIVVADIDEPCAGGRRRGHRAFDRP
jgi:hypothetical protein